jgi:outer membrane protein assembly factor BamB
MSGAEINVNPPDEEPNQPTRSEVPETPGNRRKRNRAPASRQPKPSGKTKTGVGKKTTASTKVEGDNTPAAKSTREKTVTASRRGATNRKKKPAIEQAQQEQPESANEPVPSAESQSIEQATLSVSTEHTLDTPPVEANLQHELAIDIEVSALPVEAEQDAISLDTDLDDTQPKLKVVSPAPHVEAEPEASPPELALDQTAPRIKVITIPLVEPELAVAESEPATNDPGPTIDQPDRTTCHPERSEGSRLAEPELAVSSDIAATTVTAVPVEALSREQVNVPIITRAPITKPLPALHRQPGHAGTPVKLLAWALLAVLIGSAFLFWRDVNDTHLYLYALDPASGHATAQQDLGGGYQVDSTITNPLQVTSSLMFGVQTDQSAFGARQQLFSLTRNASSWQVASQFSAPLGHGTLSLTPDQRVLIVKADGLQLLTPSGQMLWHIQGDEPALGTHPFQPAFSGSTLFAVKSALNGVVAAYDLQSGAPLWTQQLDDTLEYAAPFLLYGNTLYIAADHSLYALDRSDGTLLWKADRPTRTLLMFRGTKPLLLAAGPQGLAALNAYTGAIVWTYNGLPLNTQANSNESLVPAQFYQATIASTDNDVMYATGIVWDTQHVREQLWLFAIDAATGNVRWSEPVGSDFTNADAGRIYAPSVDTTHKLVILQQAENDSNRIITAYNTGDGAKRWSVELDGISAAAPGLLQISNTALIVLDMQSGRIAALHTWSPTRLLLIVLAGLSVVCLLLLWMLPFKLWTKRLHIMRLYLMYSLKFLQGLWRSSHTIFVLAFLPIPVLGGALLYGQLASVQNYLNQFATSSGSIQWQLSTGNPVQLAMADPQGSIVVKSVGKYLHQLDALSPGGTSQWTSFPTQGSFSLPTVSTQPGTLLVALSGHTSPQYHFAPDDPAYPHPLDSLYTLSLLDRGTGQSIWQTVIISPGGQQDSTVLGADAKFFYVASRATNPLQAGPGPVVQLIAVDKTSGVIVWRIFGPPESDTTPLDYGSLLMQGRSIFWQISDTIYQLDTTLGQIQWRKYIAENLPQVSLSEEAQMSVAGGVLLVVRSDAYHAMDLSTGNERWIIASLGNSTAQIQRGVVAVNNMFLLFGGGTLQAFDPSDQHIIWSQEQQVGMQNLKISDDGTTIYAVLDHSNPRGPTTQALEAIDVQTGTVRWTFQPFQQERFVNPHADGFQYSNGRLFTTICSTANQASCGEEALYTINAATGKSIWKFEANSIYNIHLSPSGDLVAFQTNTSAWENLLEHFR